MPQPERPVLLRAPAGDALSLQTELPNEELGYLQSRPQHFDAVAGFEHAEFGEVVQPRLEGVETLGERVVDLLPGPSSRPIAPLVGERLRLRRRRARRRGRRVGRYGSRRRGCGRRRGGRGSRRRARRGVVAWERRRGCGRRRRRLRHEYRRSGGRRRSGRLDGRRRVVSLSRAGEDAYGGGGDDGERQQDGASHLAARRLLISAVRSVDLRHPRGRSACPVAGRIIAPTVGAGESRPEVFPLPLPPLPLFLFLLLAAFLLCPFATFLLLSFAAFALLLLTTLPLFLLVSFLLLLFAALALLLLAALALRPFVCSSMRRLPCADRSPSLAKRARRSRAYALRAEEQGTRLGYFLHPRRGVGRLVPIGVMLQRLPAKRLRYLVGRSP